MVILCHFPILVKIVNKTNLMKTAHFKDLGSCIILKPNYFKGFVVLYLYFLLQNQHVMDSLKAVCFIQFLCIHL